MNKSIQRSYSGSIDVIKLIMCAVFVSLILYPFLQMVLNITADDFARLVSSKAFLPAVASSLKTALTTTAFSVSLGLILALCIQRTPIRLKGIFSLVMILPMLVPSISHGMALIVLFGTNGIITNLFQLDSTIYGFWGIVAGSVLYSYPVAFLMLNDVLKYESSTPYEAAEVLGISPIRQHIAITLPYLRRPLVSAIFAVFTMVVTDYGIPLMIGGKTTTLAVMMYQEVLGQMDFGKGSVVGLMLLIPAVIAFIFNLKDKTKGKLSFVTQKFSFKKNRLRDAVAYLMCGLVSLAVILLIVSFGIIAFTRKYPRDLTLTFANITHMLAMNGERYLLNSFKIALVVALLGCITGFVTAYLTARLPSRMSQFLHLFSITSMAIPGIVLGLSYAMTFSGSWIYGTMAILILVNLMHFFASPYLMLYNSLSKVNENLENVGQTLGISRIRIVLNVVLPQCRSTLFEVFSYFFVNSMMTISAVSFLATAMTKPISLMINQFEAQMQYECAAVVSLFILTVNMLMKAIVYLVNHSSKKAQETKFDYE